MSKLEQSCVEVGAKLCQSSSELCPSSSEVKLKLSRCWSEVVLKFERSSFFEVHFEVET